MIKYINKKKRKTQRIPYRLALFKKITQNPPYFPLFPIGVQDIWLKLLWSPHTVADRDWPKRIGGELAADCASAGKLRRGIACGPPADRWWNPPVDLGRWSACGPPANFSSA